MRVFRSADTESVVRAKIQSFGEAGGRRNSSIKLQQALQAQNK